MAYNRENQLKKIIEVQDIVLYHKKKGATQKYIYETYIKNRYFVCFATYNSWLGEPAKAQFKQLQEDKKNKCSDSENTKITH